MIQITLINVAWFYIYTGLFFLESWARQTVRLTSGHVESEGRVEVMNEGIWKVVCGDLSWDAREAHVVCSHLGYEGALAASCCGGSKDETSLVWTGSFNCSGNESSVFECKNNFERNASCKDIPPASVICSPKARLAGGSTTKEGRVQVYHSGSWGSVCSPNWDIQDATVVCRSLGYESAASTVSNATYTHKNGSVWFNDVRCIGTESSVSACAHGIWENRTCNHSQVVSVTCTGQEVRLVDGKSDAEGRVEVLYRGVWGSVCNDSWDMLDAHVTCRQLGFDGVLVASPHSAYSRASGVIWLHAVQCEGSELSLFDCTHKSWDSASVSCSHNDVAGVVCKSKVDLFSARLQFVSSGLNTITMKLHITSGERERYTLQIWQNYTKEWQNTKCKESNVTSSCVVKYSNTSITVNDLSPGRDHYFRLVSPSLEVSGVAGPMKTKSLDAPRNVQFLSSSANSITIFWTPSSSMTVNYTVEMRSYKETSWTVALCTENVIGGGCLVNNTRATVIGLAPEVGYFFRVYVVYKKWRSPVSLSSDIMRTFQGGELWIGSLNSECVWSKIGHVITLLCHVTGNGRKSYEWTKEERIVSNKSALGVLNVTIYTEDDFGVYTCHVRDPEGVTLYNISVCPEPVYGSTVGSANPTGLAVSSATIIITTCFISFALFIVVIIVLKIAKLYFRKKRQSMELSRGREDMPMLHYRHKTTRSANNDDGQELNP